MHRPTLDADHFILWVVDGLLGDIVSHQAAPARRCRPTRWFPYRKVQIRLRRVDDMILRPALILDSVSTITESMSPELSLYY